MTDDRLPAMYSGDCGEVWVVAADGRPYLLDLVKTRYEDLGFSSIEDVNADPLFGPVRRFMQVGE